MLYENMVCSSPPPPHHPCLWFQRQLMPPTHCQLASEHMVILPSTFPSDGFLIFSLILLLHQNSSKLCSCSLISELIFTKCFWYMKQVWWSKCNVIFHHLFCLDLSERAAKPLYFVYVDHSRCSVFIHIGSSEGIFHLSQLYNCSG